MASRLFFNLTILLLIAINAQAAIENLDEIASRRGRRATNTYYHGASSGNNWVRQPESLAYTDTQTGNEVWILTNTPNKSNIYYTDISPANPWSADGARLGFFSNRDIVEYNQSASSEIDGARGNQFVMRSDGAYLRAAVDSANRAYGNAGMSFFHWNPSVPSLYYTTGGREAGLNLDGNAIYKNIVSDTSIAYSKVLQLPGSVTDFYNLGKLISSDGTTLMPIKGSTPNKLYYPAKVYPENQASVIDSDGWNEQRGQTTQWSGGNPFPCAHDAYFPSKDFFILLFSTDCNDNGGPVVYKYNITGTDADGGPHFSTTETAYSTFNAKEVEPLWTWGGAPHVPWKIQPTTNLHGWGHPGFDRWGRIVVFNDGDSSLDDGTTWGGGPVAWDYKNRSLVAQSPGQFPKPLYRYAGTYNDWNAWSDWFAYGKVYATTDDTKNWIVTAEYNKTYDNGNGGHIVAYHHGDQNASTSYHWQNNARVAQSPDGTKIAYSVNFTVGVGNAGDLAYAVAYYPHPPEVTNITGSGTYTIRFDWRLATANPRGYTKRGWPDESTNNPPPPRETKSFRLWRSANGTSGWAPVTTVNADIFTRYNFSTGTWNGNDYWTFTDTPGAGTWYYAVTAIEHSGLESRTLSNVFSTAGTQTVAYPSNSKGASLFYLEQPPWPIFTTTKLSTPGQYRIEWATPDLQLIRYYNIYYSTDDTTHLKPIRQNRIASVPVGTNSYVDWLADPVKAGIYLVSSVDSQGNESSLTPLIMRITTGK